MKKLFAGMMTAMLLVAAMGTSVFAANSPSSEAALKQKAEEMNKNITSVTGIGSNNAAVTVKQEALSTDQVSQATVKVQDQYKNSNASVLAMTDLSVANGTDTSKGIKVTLTVPGVLPGDNIQVLHQKSTGDWETLPATVGNGTVTVTMKTFSPIVIVRLSGSSSGGGSSSSSSGGSSNSGTNNGQNNNNNPGGSNPPDDSQNPNDPADTDPKDPVKEPDTYKDYADGYGDGYAAGVASVKGNNENGTSGDSDNGAESGSKGGSKSGVTNASNANGNTSNTTSPKTGAALPALPMVAAFAFAGVVVCGKKARKN